MDIYTGILLDSPTISKRKGFSMNDLSKDEWKNLAYEKVLEVARINAEFTPDDIWATGLPKPQEARALGGVMLRAKNRGIIEKTGRSIRTSQPESHRADVTVWKSLIF
jgi:hypothetical protein